MYIAEPGSDSADEINALRVPDPTGAFSLANFGYPCVEAGTNITQYVTAGAAVCAAVFRDPNLTGPLYAYNASSSGAPMGRTSISAIAYFGFNDRIYYGDYMQMKILSFSLRDAQEGSITPRLESNATVPVFPVDMAPVAGRGIAYLDVVTGQLNLLPVEGASSGVPALGDGLIMATLAAFVAGVMTLFAF
jgi:hypothetical protein